MIHTQHAHVLVIGTGVAGFSAALSAAGAGADVTLVSAGTDLATRGGNTQLAQGGIAAAIGAGDDPSKHAADTVAAGAGLVDAIAAGVLTADGTRAVRDMIAAGFAVDRDASGHPTLGMEGAHGQHRIVHAGEDRSGAALHAFLRMEVASEVCTGRIAVLYERTVVGLDVRDGEVRGALLRDTSGVVHAHAADAVVLATGGYAGLYPRSTNAEGVRGDGILLAARAGALLADLEFVQFHPTVIHGTGSLVSEAVRGAGAVLRDGAGARFMEVAHPQGDLASRDVVSREIHRVLRERGDDAVWLDATGIEREGGPGTLQKRFPSITAAARAHGFDWAREPIPVSPAAHYSMGGVVTDLDARTSVPGLFAAGEVASTGVHGANRLASNSLLEGLVFGARAGRAAAGAGDVGLGGRVTGARGSEWLAPGAFADLEREQLLVAIAGDAAAHQAGHAVDLTSGGSQVRSDTTRVSEAIGTGLGIVRHADDFRAASEVFSTSTSPSAQLASLILAAAEARTESRGAHQRSDYPETDPAQAVRRSVRAVFEGSHLAERVDALRSTANHAPTTGAEATGAPALEPTTTH
ncbi:L-aspartate oxidase [Leucobacter denitrificans]|uniref:L-aspartate oxidase n=1 Tax=Leucobacter denitrificans TaxID=683042 RepID=A0A7G9S3J0_9MICO|nr:FAD-dependent oxidoreductase [Leucobacter denitrificans]QNN62415.1 FAD-binding protein [Leucobacter denitrificans]